MGAENSKPQVKKQTYDEKEISPSQSISYIQESLSTLNLSDEEIRVRYAPVTGEDIRKYARSFSQDNKNLLAMNAVAGNNPTNVLLNPRAALKDEHVFNIKLDIEGAATNQKSSGRCWLFAGTNVMRLAAINRLKLKDDFELSQSYLFFYDKFEKANWFLENMLDLANTDINDRVVQYLLADPVGDGGQWDMFVNIVEKYGVVPKSVFPETYSSSNSSRLDWLVTVKLREFATKIRDAVSQNVPARQIRIQKEEMLQDIFRILAICLGEPPTEFEWEFYDKNGKYHHAADMTPQVFMKQIIGYPIQETMSLINDPRNPIDRLYTVDRLGNVVGGKPIRYVNTTASTMKRLAINVLKTGSPVWFGCDVGQFSTGRIGAMDTSIFNYDLAFSTRFNMTKEQRLLYKESLMTHAMVFTGVHLDSDGSPVRWRVENSWGDDSGDKGFWVMSDAWFSEFVYQVVLEKGDVPRKLVSLLDTKPTVLPAYDPMGALATPH